MYSYSYDATTGGIVLNSSPTVFSKEPRPVWAAEMNLLGFHQYWNYDEQNDIPYMWAESNAYWYRGTQLAKIKGGDLYTAPELMPTRTEDNRIPFSKEDGFVLQPIDISAMSHQNEELMTIVENTTVKKIVKEYEKFKNRLDIFHVAFSGGKDSAVLLDLIKKALPMAVSLLSSETLGWNFQIPTILSKKPRLNVRRMGHLSMLLGHILNPMSLGRFLDHLHECCAGAVVSTRVHLRRSKCVSLLEKITILAWIL